LIAAYIPILVLAVPRHTPHLLLISLWTLPTLVVLITGVLRTDTSAGLHQIMLQTIRLATYFTLLLAVALIITVLWPVLPHIPAAIPF
jgi:1,4-dihydroxy-2-naphthoate octaprenyltransferase